MRYRVLIGVVYPTGESLALVRARGGLSQMTQDERTGLVLTRPNVGDVVSDVPAESVAWLLEQGVIEAVED